MRTSNPALSDRIFDRPATGGAGDKVMTVQGTINRTALLLAVLVATAAWTWHLSTQGGAVQGWLWGGLIGGLVLALITIFVPRAAPFTSLPYAACEGLFLGAISAMFEQSYPGIVLPAVGLTFGTLFAMLIGYSTGIIRVTRKFRMGVVIATGAVALVYVATMMANLFGMSVPYIHGSGPIGIAFSAVVVGIAALNLVLDFDFIERGADAGAPAYFAWYGAFGLVLTLVWLYLEILRLLSKVRG